MTVHPYRIACAPAPARTQSAGDALAFGVLGVTGAIQVALSVTVPGQPSLATLLGGTALVAALGWLTRRRGLARAAGSRHRLP